MRPTVLLLGVLAAPAAAQSTEHGVTARDVAAFIERARAGSERYHDVDVAIADGYRPLGPDAPGMGVHWLNPRLALAGRVDAAAPAFLTYVTVAGRPVLAGTGYVVPLGPDDEPPEEPAGRHAWHFHSRSVIQESVAPGRHAPDAAHEGARAAVLHAWVWLANPDGVFAPDNWALPYHRLGLAAPEGAPDGAAQALALATDEGTAYYAGRLRLMGLDAAAGDSVLRRYERRVRGWLTSRGEEPIGAQGVAALGEIWSALSEELGWGPSTPPRSPPPPAPADPPTARPRGGGPASPSRAERTGPRA